MEDTAVSQVLVEHQILSSGRGAERKTNRDVTNQMSSGVVSNDSLRTHNSRGKFVNVTASLRVIRELIDALSDDRFDFERGEIAPKRPVKNKTTTHRNTNDFRKQNMTRSSTSHDKPSNSEKAHSKEVQRQPMTYKDMPHKSFDGNKRVNVLPFPRREGRRGRFLISRTLRSSSAKSQTSPSALQVPAKYKKTHHHAEKHHKAYGLHSYDCSTHKCANNNNRNGDECRNESKSNQEFVTCANSDVPVAMKVRDAESSTVKRCKLSGESIGRMKPPITFAIPPSTMTSDSTERHPSRKEKILAIRKSSEVKEIRK